MGAPWSVEFTLFVAIIVTFLAMSFFGVSWLIRIRTCLALAVGAALLGYLAWPMVQPDFPGGAVTFYQGDIGLFTAAAFVVLAFVTGFVAYFASYPYGTRIALLAVPAGLAVWAFRGGSMTALLRLHEGLDERLSVYGAIKWEGIFWLLLVLVGAIGVTVASLVVRPKGMSIVEQDRHNLKYDKFLNVAIAVFVSVVVAHVGIMILAQDVRLHDAEIGQVIGQPAKAQIAFAVTTAFGLGAFLVKMFLKMSYVIPAVCTAIYTYLGLTVSTKKDIMTHMANAWPVAIYPMSAAAILPIEIVSYGTIGAITGYWIAIKWDEWQTQSKKES